MIQHTQTSFGYLFHTPWRTKLITLYRLYVFFVLRKKQKQITALHLIHHAGLCIISNWGLRHPYEASAFYIAFAFTNNSAVHVIMYIYYGLAACGPSMKKYLWWKRYLTLIQITQLLIILSYMTYGFLSGCEEFGKFEQTAYIFVAINVLLFVHFYSNYSKKNKNV
ncbi:elongation of very long chain fatty acids protein [Trichonephila clavipes]|nr:elongation of very long chain fatty acids protein [Trichonephila clavipes]